MNLINSRCACLLLLLIGRFFPVHPQTVSSSNNIVIDANPTSNRSDSLEKIVDYFTSTSVPSAILGMGQFNGGPGGLFLYTTSNPLTGPWRKSTIAASGNFYEQARAFKYPGDTYPGVIASVSERLIWFVNPANQGHDPTTYPWAQIVINAHAGAHDLQLVDVDGDGKLDVVASGAIFQDTVSFIAFQNSPTSWTIKTNATPADDGIATLSVAGLAGQQVVGCNGNSLYWYQNPISVGGNARTGHWAAHYIGQCAEGIAVVAGSFNGHDGAVVASNETTWSPGLVWYEPTSNPYAAWTQHSVDSSIRDSLEVTTGVVNGVSYITVGEEEQASSACNNSGLNEHPGTSGCRVSVYAFNNTTHTFNSPTVLSLRGTQNQATLPYGGGFLMVGANHHVYGGYPAFQSWFIRIAAGGGGSPTPTPPPVIGGVLGAGTYAVTNFSSKALDGGFYYWARDLTIKEWQENPSNTMQQWKFTQVSAGVFTICNVGDQNAALPNSCLTDQQQNLAIGYTGMDNWTVGASGNGYTIKNNRTGRFIGPDPAASRGTMHTGTAPVTWSIHQPI